MSLTNRILKAVEAQEQQTADELQETLGETNRKRLLDNCTHLVNRGLIVRQPHEITRLPAYCITAAGREKLKGAGEDPQEPAAPSCPIPVFTEQAKPELPAKAGAPEGKPDWGHYMVVGHQPFCADRAEAVAKAENMVKANGGTAHVVMVVATAKQSIVWDNVLDGQLPEGNDRGH